MLHAKLASRLSRHAGLRFFRLFARSLESDSVEPPAALRLRPLAESDVIALCGDRKLDLRREGVAAACSRGDLCVGAFDGESLAGYCWFAFTPLPHLDGVWVKFDRLVAWPYKSFVRPAHRGRGIAPALYRFADTACRERGRRHSVICVESHNRSSIAAATRAGYRDGGYGAYLLRGSHLHTWSSSAARHHGVSFYLPGGNEG